MDYGKKYNHALEVVRELQKDWASTQNRAAREIELAFPELRESEDERIRKVIFKLLLGMREEIFTSQDDIVTKEKALAYLEKQKDAFENGRQFGIMQEQARQELEWTDEKQKEQKPAWSEEDERRIDAICELLENTSAIHPNYSHRKLIIWLKSLRSQPKQEWSEEDEKMFASISNLLWEGYGCFKENKIPTPEWSKIRNWLKSLRPQPKPEVTDEEIEEMVTKRSRSTGTTKSEMDFYRNGIKDAIKQFGLRPSWKPSEEQMMSLRLSFEEAFDDAGDCNRYRRLKSLYEHLKKL